MRRPLLNTRALVVVVLLGASMVGTGACRRDPAAIARDHTARAHGYVKAGKLKEAALEYTNAIKAAPRDGRLWLEVADFLAAVGNKENAAQAYARASDLLPEDDAVQLRVGAMMIASGAFDQGQARVERVLRHDPRNVDALVLRGLALAGLKDVNKALELAQQATRDQPDQANLVAALGQLQFIKGQNADAEASMKRALELRPHFVAARLALATYYWSAKRPADAEAQLQAAHREEPNNGQVNRALAMVYLGTNRPADAEAALKRWFEATRDPGAALALADLYAASRRVSEARAVLSGVEAGPLGGPATVRLAAYDVREGRREAAYDRLRAFLKRQPRDEEALKALAGLLIADNKSSEAVQRLREATAAHPSSAGAQYAMGDALLASGNRDEAIQAFRRAVKLDPALSAAHLRLSALYLAGGDTDNALQFAREAIAADPRNAFAHLALARVLQQRGDLSGARTEVERLLKDRPGWPVAELERGRIEAAAGKHDAALRIFTGILLRDPDSLDALAGAVTSQLALGRPAPAAALVDARLAAHPDDVNALMLASSVADAAGDVARTERTLKRVLELAPNNLNAYGLLGQLYARTHRLEEARRQFEAIAGRAEKPVSAYTMLALTYEIEGRKEEASKLYEKALALDARAPVAANNLAWLLAQHDETLGRAQQLAMTAREEMPRQPEVNDTLGWIYYRQGVSQMAIARLEEAAQAQPDSAVYQYHLGLAYEQAGDTRRARAALERALASRAPFAERGDAERVLAKLRQ